MTDALPVDPLPVEPVEVKDADVGAVLAAMVNGDVTDLTVLTAAVFLLVTDLRAAGRLDGDRWASLDSEAPQAPLDPLPAPPVSPPSPPNPTAPSPPPSPPTGRPRL